MIFITSSLFAVQAQEYAFEKLDIEQGLSQNFIFEIEQDFRGFLWIATRDGLNRYDGYDFKIYNHIPTDSNSLSSNIVTALHEDDAHNLWIGAGALDRYDRLHDRIERVITADDLQLSQPSLNIEEITIDHHGDIWIAIRDIGLYRIEEGESMQKAVFTAHGPYQIIAKNHYLNSNEHYYDIQSVGDQLWVSHSQGLFLLAADEEGYFPRPSSAEFQSINFGLSEQPLLCKAILLDGNTLWISSLKGLIQLPEPEHHEDFQLYSFPTDMPSSPALAIAKDMDIDSEGSLWMTSFSGIYIFNPSSQRYQHIPHDPKDNEGLSLDNTTGILIDRSGLVWIGTGGLGINKYDSRQNRFTHLLGKQKTERLFSVYNIVEDDQGVVWFSENNNKLGFLNPEANTHGLYEDAIAQEWYISDMAKDQDGILWMANKFELIRFDPDSQTYTAFLPENVHALSENDNFTIDLDHRNEVWLCNTQGLLHFDRQNETFTEYLLPDLNLEHINTLYHDQDGRLWIGSHQGLVSYDLRQKKTYIFRSEPSSTDSLNHSRVKVILPDPVDPERYLWIGTGGGGISKFDKENRRFTAFTQEDGMPNNFVYGILADKQNKLWISTNKGLSRFDPQTKKFENFVQGDGLQSNEFNSRAYYKNDRGEMYFGGINGITKFKPESILPNTHVPPIVISYMWLMYKSIYPNTEHSPLKFAVNETKELHLNYDQNNISFSFTALDFTAPEKNQYRYKLEGFDKSWIKASAERRASYTNLPPGDYTFRVMGSNNDGIWSQEDASMSISISPPIWKTWWAYIVYCLMTCGIVLLFHRYQTERIRMGEEIKRKAFQNEKLAELDQFKSRFFANISHEFRTPLSLILGHADSVEETIVENQKQKVQPLLSSIKVNAYHVIGLIDQLLDIARLENNSLKINSVAGDLSAFLTVLCNSLQSGAEQKGINLSFYSSSPYLYARLDWEIIQKIFQNLIVNAIKFTPEGGNIKVSLETYQFKENQSSEYIDWCRVQVRDNGIGISEDQLPYIFDRFYTSNHDKTSIEKGFGLGLSMVRELVSLLGGKIEIESKLGKGSVFTIHIPYSVPEENISNFHENGVLDNYLIKTAKAGLNSSQKPNVGILKANKEKKESILLVEDKDEFRAYLRQMLSAEYEIYEAENGKEGLELATQTIPDLIITDLMMPELDGMELSKTLKTDFKTSHIPIIILTAKADVEGKLDSLDIGVDDYLVKPFNKKELKKKIRSLINIRQLLRLKYNQSLLSPNQNMKNQPSLEEKFLKQLHYKIQSNLPDEHYGVEKLAAELSMSPSQLYRKVKALTGFSTVQLIQTYRIELAKAYLEQGYNVSEVTYMVGFTSPAYFSQIFKKYTSQKPKDYGKKDYSQS